MEVEHSDKTIDIGAYRKEFYRLFLQILPSHIRNSANKGIY